MTLELLTNQALEMFLREGEKKEHLRSMHTEGEEEGL